MRKNLSVAAVAIVAAMALASCDEDTMTIGQSLTYDSDKLDLSSTTFLATTRSVVAGSVLSLSTDCYLGRVKDPETGAVVTSEFTTQFHLLGHTYISPEEMIKARHDGRAAADSCDIIIYLSNPFVSTDSLSAMKMCVSELGVTTPEGQKYYSDFDPVAEGLIRADGLRKYKMFTLENLLDSDSLRATSTYLDNIRISLNQPYTDRDGTTYNNYGSYVMRQYYDHPERFVNSFVFAHEVCPGFFFEITDGLGFHAKVSDIGMRIYYTIEGSDSEAKKTLTLAGTKEVLQTNRVTNDAETIGAMTAEQGYTYLKSPAGIFTEVTLPVEEIKNYVGADGVSHAKDSLVAAKLTFQRQNNMSADRRLLGIPQTLLLVQKDSLHSFFENNNVPNNNTSYYTNFSSDYNVYTFTNVSNLVTALWQMRQEGEKTDPDWVAHHPDWNRMVLVPVTCATSTSSGTTTVTSVQHDMSLCSTRLAGGTGPDAKPIEMSVVYARFNN